MTYPSQRRQLPEPDTANPDDGYRRHGIADLCNAQLRLNALRARRLHSAQQARDAADSGTETRNTLGQLTTHMSPWDAAWNRLRPDERAWSSTRGDQ